jgi:hypothetical protein
MLYGFGWRITGQHEGAGTRSLLLSTPDLSGARFVLTCNTRGAAAEPRPAATATAPISTASAATAPARVVGDWGGRDWGPVATAPVATAPVADGHAATCTTFDHFSRTHLERYFAYHGGAQGIGVLGFELETGQLDLVQAREPYL